MLEKLSLQLARRIATKEAGTTDDIEILNYEISIRLTNYSIIILTFVFSFVMGTLIESMASLICLAMLRKYSGGIHFKSLTTCVITSVLLFLAVPYVGLNQVVTSICTFVSFAIMLIFAPNSFIEINPSRVDRYRKMISVAIVTVNFIIQSNEIAVIFLIQAITILPWKGGDKHEEYFL